MVQRVFLEKEQKQLNSIDWYMRRKGWLWEAVMFRNLIVAAHIDKDLKIRIITWLKNGRTVYVRDEIFLRYRDKIMDTHNKRNSIDFKIEYDSAYTALDAASIHRNETTKEIDVFLKRTGDL